MNVVMAGKESLVIRKPHATTSITVQAQATEYVGGQISVAVMTDISDVTAVSLLRAQMCLIALEEGSVLTMTYASARRTGPEKTVPRSPVDLSTIAPNAEDV